MNQAQAQYDSIVEMLAAVDAADSVEDPDAAYQAVYDHALSVEFRSGWGAPYSALEPSEYRIVLCTGGPHVEIQGDLDHGSPTSAKLYQQDWFEPLKEFGGAEEQVLLRYAYILIGG